MLCTVFKAFEGNPRLKLRMTVAMVSLFDLQVQIRKLLGPITQECDQRKEVIFVDGILDWWLTWK